MWDHLGLFAPVFDRLAFIVFKAAIDTMAAPWPVLYLLTPSDSFSNLPLQIICLLTISTTIFCYTTIGSKMLKLSSQFDLLLVKKLMICLLYPHLISLNHAAYRFTLTVSDKVWVMNFDKSKLQPKKVGPVIILKVNENNTYLVQGLGKGKQDKVLHHDCLRPCKARQKQCETALPATEQQLVQYGTRAPDNLPDNLPPEEANLQSGEVLKQQAQPTNKVPSKQVCDPQSNYPVTQSQTRKPAQISKSNNMNRLSGFSFIILATIQSQITFCFCPLTPALLDQVFPSLLPSFCFHMSAKQTTVPIVIPFTLSSHLNSAPHKPSEIKRLGFPILTCRHFSDLEIEFLTKSSVIKTGLYFIFLGSLSSVATEDLARLFVFD
ncbi:hypothetical protein DSO57_1006594 [Entomophthora muscae]|uniref:Uncharacterized protein n=1 Tax=Entomophthora muscae TaxID=34485 RepID=A0ACC2SKM3_9FUNG|nr:hypothetical protein DSO57_1006594 [Entomophthora muscae]